MEKLIKLTSDTEELINNQALHFGQAVFSPLYPATIQIHAKPETTKLIQQTIKDELYRYLGETSKNIDTHSMDDNDFNSAEKYSDKMIPYINNMLMTHDIFKDMTNILFFDIIQTSCFDSLEKFTNHFNICSEYRYDSNHPVNKMLFLIADDRPTITKEIFNYLHENNNSNYASIVILSDQLKNGGIISENDPLRFKAIASLISLTNKQSDPTFYRRLFDRQNNIFTMGYIYQNKPVSIIAKYTISSLINCIMEKFNNMGADPITTEDLRKVYCPNYNFVIIYKYFDKSKYVSNECMKYFPSSDTPNVQDIRNEMWKLFFEKNFRVKAIQDAKDVYGQIKDEFLKILLQNFTYQQLSQTENIKILETFWSTTKGNESEPGFSYEKAMEQAKIIYTNYIIEKLSKDINDIFETARKMQNQLMEVNYNMQKIINTIHSHPMANSIEAFYKSQVVSNYVDSNWLEILNDFNTADDDIAIINILEKHTNEIIHSNNIYSASFEKELQARLDFAGAAAPDILASHILDTNNRTIFMTFMKVGDEKQEICVVPVNSGIASQLAGGINGTTTILEVPADQYIERIALFDAKNIEEY